MASAVVDLAAAAAAAAAAAVLEAVAVLEAAPIGHAVVHLAADPKRPSVNARRAPARNNDSKARVAAAATRDATRNGKTT